MKVLSKKWRLPACGLLTVGLVAVITCYFGGVEQLSRFFSPNASLASGKKSKRDR